jgi:hypothetical protein
MLPGILSEGGQGNVDLTEEIVDLLSFIFIPDAHV